MFNHYDNYEDFRNALFRWFHFEEGEIREDHLKRAWELIKDKKIHIFCDPSNEFCGCDKTGYDSSYVGFEFFSTRCGYDGHLEKNTVMCYKYTPSKYCPGRYNKETLFATEKWD